MSQFLEFTISKRRWRKPPLISRIALEIERVEAIVDLGSRGTEIRRQFAHTVVVNEKYVTVMAELEKAHVMTVYRPRSLVGVEQ